MSQKIGLALGSGSARGWAHIGVIEALHEDGIDIDVVAGTSIGALVGAVFAAGKIMEFKEVILDLDWKKILSMLDVVFPKTGLLDGKKVAEFVQNYVQDREIDDFLLPFCAVCTDLKTGEEVRIFQGGVIEAVRASIAVPGIFTPVMMGKRCLVDGGLVNPVPVSVVRKMGADLVIAVDLNHDIVGRNLNIGSKERDKSCHKKEKPRNKVSVKDRVFQELKEKIKNIDVPLFDSMRQWMVREHMPNIFDIILTSINIMENQITQANLRLEPPDILIRPSLGHIKFMDFHRAEEAIYEGYQAAKKELSNWKRLKEV
ncbi:patatin-like phospholipase family protein [Desulfohalobiaceae bacterium Ax17]|uniref:patatin-like phospholipase family protein n=1 Tax=Desulfovulcanus ferrireducens TaxID=2831190 RepID=UPI00207BC84A|nr:patatin-like phospholipase family protein [Desulfovulcanus ferrireducens]MBT8762319.1 patatin-like phospholipase family protein [Desulfovulcanus ferrireducens]